MKHSTWFRMAWVLLAAAGALVMPQPAVANPIVPFTLAFEREGLDLDTGTIVPIEPWTLAVNPANPVPVVYGGSEALRHALDVGLARPTALAAGDFDEDGVADLIGGYASPDGGIVTLHRGNVDAIFPYTPEARQRRSEGTFTDEPFLSPAEVFETPVKPDFLAAGDFDNDGHWDVVAAAAGEASLYLLAGDGRGGLQPAEQVKLAGALTALVAGEINRADGLVDLVVGVRGPDGPALLVFEGPEGALRSAAEVLPVSAAPTALLLARLGDGPWRDLVVAAGDELLIVRGRDRRLVLGEAERAEVGPPVTERIEMPSAIEALAWGDFAWEPTPSRELALLLEDGTVRLLGREGDEGRPTDVNPDLSWKTIGQREVLAPGAYGRELSPARRVLLPVRISGLPTEDLVIFDATSDRLQVLAGMVREDPAAQGAAGTVTSLADPGVVASLDLEGSPVAALPMRLNRDALTDLVLLQQGTVAPLVAATAAQATITVDTALDNATGGDGLCTLREAINNANSDSDTTGGDCVTGSGVDAIDFNIGGGGAPATIAPLSALPVITDPVTIDGTTQNCASPPCVVLDGSGAGSVVAGVQLAAGSSTVRGLVVQQFLGIAGDPDVNGYGIFITSSGNIIEGNYSGTDVTGMVDLGNAGASLRIEDGSNNTVGGTAAGAGNLLSGADQNGLVIRQLVGTASGNQVLGNLIGTDRTGMVGLGNILRGVVINTSSNNTIGGTTAGARNVISFNGNDGVRIRSSTGNQVLGNFIGTDISGIVDLGNTGYGVFILEGSNNTIGGTSAGARNIISGNEMVGVFIDPAVAMGNQVLGNFIGTDVTGHCDLGNTFAGVNIHGSNNTIGGTSAGARNIISGNDFDGVFIGGTPAVQGNQVLGNFIGTDVTGTIDLGNSGNGVAVETSNNTIGGTTSGARNIISGNDVGGVVLFNNVTGVSVLGNYIGTQIDGTSPLGNSQDGVAILDGASNNTIGGTGVTPGKCDGPCNRIGFSQNPPFDGVRIYVGSGNGNAILGNSIFASAELGIDLGLGGVTPNDVGDPDAGANTLQNFPVLSLAEATPLGATVDGSLNSTSNQNFRIEFFANLACDASGNGEGARFLGFTDVLTDGSGNVNFSAALSGPVSDGEAITATATTTGLSTNTSEFSACIDAVCLSLAIFGQTITTPDKNSLSWTVQDDVRFVKGDLADVSSYLFTETGELIDATSLDISSDSPGAGSGLYYLIRSLACGSWQTTPGAEPARDVALP